MLFTTLLLHWPALHFDEIHCTALHRTALHCTVPKSGKECKKVSVKKGDFIVLVLLSSHIKRVSVSHMWDFSSCFEPLKKKNWNFNIKIHKKKKRNIRFMSLTYPSFDELHCSRIVHRNHMDPIFLDILFFISPRWSKKTLFTFVQRAEPTSWCLLRPWYNLFVWEEMEYGHNWP